MRVASNDLVLKSAIQQAQAEAQAAFGNSAIYLEKYIEHPRHVEIQIMADLALVDLKQRAADIALRFGNGIYQDVVAEKLMDEFVGSATRFQL